MTSRTLLGLGRGACLGFVATVTADGWLALAVLLALVGALVLTDAISDLEETQ